MTLSRQWIRFVRGEWWWFSYCVVFAAAFFILLPLQNSQILADPDSFYHAKMAILLRDQGLVRSFPWLDLTVLGQHYTDQHLLYHALLIPFVTWLPPLVGIKLATVFFASTLACAFYAVLRSHQVRWAFLFTIILLLIRPFTFRISLAKAPSTSLIFLIVGMSWIFRYHIKRTFALAFTYVWYYGGFPLLGVVAAVYSVVAATMHRWFGKAEPHRLMQRVLRLLGKGTNIGGWVHPNAMILLATLAGLTAGVIFHPYFPDNLHFYFQQLYNIGVVNFQSVIGVGAEWYPYNFTELLANAAFASLLVLLGLLSVVTRWKQQTKQSLTLMILMFFFLALTLKSRRYVEYYVPFAVLFSAFAISDGLQGISWSFAWSEARRLFLKPVWAQIAAGVVATYLLFGVGYIAGRDYDNEIRELRHGYPTTKFEKVGTWLAANTPANSRVVHSDWDEFPVLFYYDSHNRYIIGLDPTFLYQASTDRYWTWVNITLGKYQGDVYQAVTKTLDSQFVFIAKTHSRMLTLFRNDTRFKLVYEDNEAYVYQPLPLTTSE